MHMPVGRLERKLRQTTQSAEERAGEIRVPMARELSLAQVVRLVLRYSQQDNLLNHFARYLIAPLYGWFTSLIILLLYIYWSSILLLAGAEINRAIESNGAAADERTSQPTMKQETTDGCRHHGAEPVGRAGGCGRGGRDT